MNLTDADRQSPAPAPEPAPAPVVPPAPWDGWNWTSDSSLATIPAARDATVGPELTSRPAGTLAPAARDVEADVELTVPPAGTLTQPLPTDATAPIAWLGASAPTPVATAPTAPAMTTPSPTAPAPTASAMTAPAMTAPAMTASAPTAPAMTASALASASTIPAPSSPAPSATAPSAPTGTAAPTGAAAAGSATAYGSGGALVAPEPTSEWPPATPAWGAPPPAGPGQAAGYATGPGKGPGWAAVVGIAGITGLIASLAGAGLGASLAGRDLFGGTAIERPAGSFAALAAKALPSVVTIRATGSSGSGATGSGFVFDTSGHVITNNHVVEGVGDEITVVLTDGSALEAEIVGSDPAYDIAVLKVERRDLTPLPMGDSAAVVVGDEVLAMGAPLGLESTVTSGIVSATNRPVVAGDSSSRSYINAIQTDAAINPGNSGGPLIDMSGRVIGVNSAIATPPGSANGAAGNVGLGFAIPAAQVLKTAGQLIDTGSAQHPVIGVLLDTSYSGPGARVRADGDEPVTEGGPADKAGVEPGDVIVRFDGRTVQGPDDLIVAIRSKSVGDTVQMTVQRDGKPVDVTMTLQAAPEK